jgi:hypothetical protein
VTLAPVAVVISAVPWIVVVGDEDVRQLPIARLQGGEDGRGLGHVDKGGFACGGVVDEVGVVISQAGDGDEFKGHGVCPVCG